MKTVRIRQLEKFVRSMQADGYSVNVLIKQRRLVININLSKDNAEEIMAKWNDLKRIGD